MNMFPLPIRLAMLAFGVTAFGLIGWAWIDQNGATMIPQMTLALIGAGVMLVTSGLWPLRPSQIHYKLLFGGACTFLIGLTWMMTSRQDSILSFPGILMCVLVGGGIVIILAPKRFFDL